MIEQVKAEIVRLEKQIKDDEERLAELEGSGLKDAMLHGAEEAARRFGGRGGSWKPW
jgi:hypothetical protein